MDQLIEQVCCSSGLLLGTSALLSVLKGDKVYEPRSSAVINNSAEHTHKRLWYEPENDAVAFCKASVCVSYLNVFHQRPAPLSVIHVSDDSTANIDQLKLWN